MLITKEYLCKINDKDIYKYILENDTLRVELFNLGCIINKFIYKPLNQNIVMGYEFVEKYLSDTAYIGRAVGVTAGRIENATYYIDNNKYSLLKNEGENNLHGGIGLSNEIFDTFLIKNGIEFRLSKREEYGNITVNIEYAIQYILENNKLKIRNYAVSTDNVFVNMTNHSYFKLDNTNDIKNHYLKINADKVYEIKENKVASLEATNVLDTNFDLREYKLLGDVINKGISNEMKNTLGIDNPFLINRENNINKALSFYSPTNNLELSIYTTEDVVVCYTGNYLDETISFDNNKPNVKYQAVAFEPQNHPNIINDNELKSKYITKRDKPYFSEIVYELGIRK